MIARLIKKREISSIDVRKKGKLVGKRVRVI